MKARASWAFAVRADGYYGNFLAGRGAAGRRENGGKGIPAVCAYVARDFFSFARDFPEAAYISSLIALLSGRAFARGRSFSGWTGGVTPLAEVRADAFLKFALIARAPSRSLSDVTLLHGVFGNFEWPNFFSSVVLMGVRKLTCKNEMFALQNLFNFVIFSNGTFCCAISRYFSTDSEWKMSTYLDK